MDTIKMIEVVKAYIYHRKGKDVEIRTPQHAFEYAKLVSAYHTAVNWFNENGSIRFSR